MYEDFQEIHRRYTALFQELSRGLDEAWWDSDRAVTIVADCRKRFGEVRESFHLKRLDLRAVFRKQLTVTTAPPSAAFSAHWSPISWATSGRAPCHMDVNAHQKAPTRQRSEPGVRRGTLPPGNCHRDSGAPTADGLKARGRGAHGTLGPTLPDDTAKLS